MTTVEDFDVFWSVYPKHVAKADAKKAWAQKVAGKVDLPRIMQSVEAFRVSGMWDEYQYIPYPATWIRAERWEDELPASPSKGRDRALMVELNAGANPFDHLMLRKRRA